jgi:cytochrome c-type biogenesis protein CcsB
VTATFAVLSNNFMYSASAVFALAMLAYAAEWAFARERRTAAVREGVLVGAGAPVDAPAAPAAAEADRSDRFGRIGVSLSVLATSLLGAAVLCRGLAAERVPWSNLYEFTTTGAFLIAVAYLAFLPRLRIRWLGLPVTAFVLLVMMVALILLYSPVSGLIPALRSYWLIIHVSAAALATGVFSVGAFASVLQLVRARAERRAVSSGRPIGTYLSRLPTAEAIDRVAYRLHAFAFPIWTFALICGAIWAERAWGRFWGWDPKETWMFITWICYAAYLHARSTAGWRTKVSWISLVAYAALLFNLIGVNLLFSGLHSYAGI